MPMGTGEKTREKMNEGVEKAFLENCRYTEKRTEKEHSVIGSYGRHGQHKHKK